MGVNQSGSGRERSSQLQVLPRKVSKIVRKVTDVALSVRILVTFIIVISRSSFFLKDTAMACLLDTGDVIFIWNGKEIKIKYVPPPPICRDLVTLSPPFTLASQYRPSLPGYKHTDLPRPCETPALPSSRHVTRFLLRCLQTARCSCLRPLMAAAN